MCGRTLLKLRTLNPQIQIQFISLEDVVPSAPPLGTLPFSTFIEEINPLVPAKSGVTFSEGNAGQDNTSVPPGTNSWP